MAGIKWTEKENKKLVSSYEFFKVQEVQKSFPNRTWSAIKIQAGKLNLRRKANDLVLADLNQLLEESPIAYYWIGFLLADGHFSKTSRLQLILANLDREHVEKFAYFIKFKGVERSENNTRIFIMDKIILPKIKQKFDIRNDKTYYPPILSSITQNKDLILSLIIGFIDGDGCIRNQSNRKDSLLSIHCHSSWIDNLRFISKTLCNESNLSPNKAIIGNDGYARVSFTNSIVLKWLKRKAIKLKIPILKRKWDKIDLSFISRQELSKQRVKQVKRLLKSGGYSIKDIAKKIGVSSPGVRILIKRNNLQVKGVV